MQVPKTGGVPLFQGVPPRFQVSGKMGVKGTIWYLPPSHSIQGVIDWFGGFRRFGGFVAWVRASTRLEARGLGGFFSLASMPCIGWQ